MSKIVLNLSFPHVSRTDSHHYRVESITGSTSHQPGELLSKNEVDEILQYKKSWTVNMGRNKDPK